MKNSIKNIAGAILTLAPKSIQTTAKEFAELLYWKRVLKKSKGTFYNGHYERNFTELFDLPKSHFDGKRMLDIGCGPLGSLEWADNAAEWVGVDPLADKYRALNKGAHRMRYLNAGCECLPLADATFDVVSMFNALDHVEDVAAAMREAQRVLAPAGDLLLIVEIGHKPTVTEPQILSEDMLNAFADCSVLLRKVFAIRDNHNVYASITDARPRASASDPAILCARLRKN